MDGDSLRAFPASLRVSKVSKSGYWGERNARSMQHTWDGDEVSTAGQTTSHRPKKMKDENNLIGRFTTSTKPWLDGYDTVRNQFKERKSTSNVVGRALFNLKRTLPPSTKDDANANIKQFNRRNLGTPAASNPLSPKRLSQFLNTS